MEYDLPLEDPPGAKESSKKDSPCAEKSMPGAPAAKHCGPGWPGAIFISCAVSIAVATVTTWVYDARYAQKIVAVDIKGYVARQGDDYLAGKITEDQFRKSFDHLQKVVESIPSNKAVLMGDLVVRNVESIKP